MADKKRWSVRLLLFFAGLVLLIVLLLQPIGVYHINEGLAVIFPKGAIGIEQRDLLLIIQGIMLLVIIPVYILTFVFSWRYRASNKGATYHPHFIDNVLAEIVWWGIPILATGVICVLTWIKTYELDPYKPLISDNKPITIQAVALQWKWLFIYPDEGIATLNYLQIPTNVPIHFEVTADAPMNSLWIPKLGGQIYAMPNAKTELNLIANEEGNFRGSSANISGVGFSGMHFNTKATEEEVYKKWVSETKKAASELGFTEYQKLAEPSQDIPPALFRLSDPLLFDKILDKYSPPEKGQVNDVWKIIPRCFSS